MQDRNTLLGAPLLAALSLGLAGALLAAPSARADALSAKADAFLRPLLAQKAAPGYSLVILKLKGSLTAAQEASLKSLGADITRRLTFIQSVAIRVPTRSLAKIAVLPFVTHLSADGLVKKCDEFTCASTGADVAFQQYALTGKGVAVAVVDSGIRPDADMGVVGTTQSRLVGSWSFVPNDLNTDDLCGHGTHVAGIIAGNGAASTGSQYTHTFYGIARQANLVSARVLDANGQGSVSTVLAGLQWVIQNKTTYNIRVINLSLGHPVGESYTTDPLCQAVEAAYKAGIVVVCAAGNAGRQNSAVTAGQANEGYGTAYGSIQSPGNDPYVITVGATKSMDGSRCHDKIATYSSRGPSRLDLILKPDIIAPGNKIISTYSYNSTLYKYNTANSNGLPVQSYMNTSWTGYSTDYFRLSGTSMAAPVVAGAAALLLQANPNLSPDTIKARLMISADKWTDGSAANQHWIFQDVAAPATNLGTTILSGRTYRIVNVNSDQALDDTGWSTANGTQMEQWDSWGGAPQQWTVTDLGGGYWKLVNANSGKVLEVGGYSNSAGGNVQQWDWVGHNWQQWGLVPVGDGSYKIVNRGSGLVVDVDGASMTHGALVHQWPDLQDAGDPCTYGAGYLNIPAALQNTVVATQPALSPALTQGGSGNVYLDTSKIVSGSHIIWGTNVTDLHIIWGSHIIWGDNTLAASHIIWGSSVWSDHVIWGTTTSAVDLTSTALYGE